ncbi:MAG: ribonuclease PH [Chloroflexi bacterium]|nr:ribonuclease PH [Chloroflexota bacterium]
MRVDGRLNDECRSVRITPGYLRYAEGSALIEMGNTVVLCAVTMEPHVPSFLRGAGQGWVTAEYAMLPRSTVRRTARALERGEERGRTYEIQRLIGRSLRAVTDLHGIGERTFLVDCDVIQADGGTRTAAITGGYVALYQASLNLVRQDILDSIPLTAGLAAISVGVVDGEYLLDLCYEEDYRAQVDFNVAMTDRHEYVEVQGAAEQNPYGKAVMEALLALAEKGFTRLFQVQKSAIAGL